MKIKIKYFIDCINLILYKDILQYIFQIKPSTEVWRQPISNIPTFNKFFSLPNGIKKSCFYSIENGAKTCSIRNSFFPPKLFTYIFLSLYFSLSYTYIHIGTTVRQSKAKRCFCSRLSPYSQVKMKEKYLNVNFSTINDLHIRSKKFIFHSRTRIKMKKG